jgi:hypothetical protein
MKHLIFLTIFFVNSVNIYSQTFNEHYFTVNEKCKLIQVLDTYDGNDKIVVYQCSDGETSDIFRVIVTAFNKKITNTDTYYNTLKSEYSKLGQIKEITINGKKAIQVVENILIEGRKHKQVSVAMLHKGKSITLVLVTKSVNYTDVINRFKSNFKLL